MVNQQTIIKKRKKNQQEIKKYINIIKQMVKNTLKKQVVNRLRNQPKNLNQNHQKIFNKKFYVQQQFQIYKVNEIERTNKTHFQIDIFNQQKQIYIYIYTLKIFIIKKKYYFRQEYIESKQNQNKI
ncbi:hypothetical protein TTHERM_000348349 (macronuclear) [Tetrahymena thermophila SB210]|uniref:Uncharacterized protein n=1 Tax=Tetrahymena thermophila (strain SB210) TaxID=312017 RepID=W7X7T8_TETTS|nr:hypothetical protein TTHERM_000348349 [Tetrahymena thermophila SB210]EWS72488.1 hypothetical protein TTHERM_000348349 [Tetrahymena thermophila SB210]|eukprot:XP_012654985.1 hypothetical protein TTHERM_000348349 [Tetrahymena thermophila SB210]